MSVSAILNLWR